MDWLGYKITTEGNGNYSVKHVAEGDEKKPYVSLATFYQCGQKDYPNLKVGRPTEDICEQCYIFSNGLKYLANHTTNSTALLHINSTANDSLFYQ